MRVKQRPVADDCEGQSPRRDREPLPGEPPPLGGLARWMRHWTTVQHRDGARSAAPSRTEASPSGPAEMMLVAATGRCFAEGGDALDFVNKTFECRAMRAVWAALSRAAGLRGRRGCLAQDAGRRGSRSHASFLQRRGA